MKESVVEIPSGSGNRYRYRYDPGSKKTIYLGPAGQAPEIGEQEFMDFAGLNWFPTSRFYEEIATEINEDLRHQLADLPIEEINVAEGRIKLLRGVKTITLPSGEIKMIADHDDIFWWNEPELASERAKAVDRWLKRLTAHEVIHIESLDIEDRAVAERVYNTIEDTWQHLGKKKVIVEVWPQNVVDQEGFKIYGYGPEFFEGLGFSKVMEDDIGGGEVFIVMEKDLEPIKTREGI